MWSNPHARVAVDRREPDQGDVREETVVGNACGGSQTAMNTSESHVGGGAITIASHFPQASISSRTIKRLAHQTPDVPIYRVGPQWGQGGFYVPDALNNTERPQAK